MSYADLDYDSVDASQLLGKRITSCMTLYIISDHVMCDINHL